MRCRLWVAADWLLVVGRKLLQWLWLVVGRVVSAAAAAAAAAAVLLRGVLKLLTAASHAL